MFKEKTATLKMHPESPESSKAIGSGRRSTSAGGNRGVKGLKEQGATRGRRDRAQKFYPRARPAGLNSKHGEEGTNHQLGTNYFELITRPNWRLWQ